MATTTQSSTTLDNGDRLSLAEFSRRYCARTDIRHAELIEGVVHLPSPTRIPQHGRPHGLVAGWLAAYCARVPGVALVLEGTVTLSEDSQVEPDAFLYRVAEGASRFQLTDEGYGVGPPDFVVEVAASSASYDLHNKLRAYERAGVPEYVVWRVEDRQVDWFRLVEGRYVRVEPDAQGIIASSVFPGLRLTVPGLLAGDYAAVLGAIAG